MSSLRASSGALLAAALFGIAASAGAPSIPPDPLPSSVLQRGDARAWNVELRGRLSPTRIRGEGPPLALETCEFVFPFVERGPTSVMDVESMWARVSVIDGGSALPAWTGLKDERLAFEATSASVVVSDVATQDLFVRLSGRIVSYATRIDDTLALDAAWPAEWPAPVVGALEVEGNIGPVDFGRFRDRAFASVLRGGNPRGWAPYALAKALARQAINQFRWSEDFLDDARRRGRAESGWWHELDLPGLPRETRRGLDARPGEILGGPLVLTLATVMLMREAGLPARPVFGLARDRGGPYHAVWGEFFLHGPGWIPFDPEVMRTNGIQGLRYDQAWRGFGNLPDLNRRVPLSYQRGGRLSRGEQQVFYAQTGSIGMWRALVIEARGRAARLDLNWSMTSAPSP